jgi:hypothetical protein
MYWRICSGVVCGHVDLGGQIIIVQRFFDIRMFPYGDVEDEGATSTGFSFAIQKPVGFRFYSELRTPCQMQH